MKNLLEEISRSAKIGCEEEYQNILYDLEKHLRYVTDLKESHYESLLI
jgi:hypothetical protein